MKLSFDLIFEKHERAEPHLRWVALLANLPMAAIGNGSTKAEAVADLKENVLAELRLGGRAERAAQKWSAHVR